MLATCPVHLIHSGIIIIIIIMTKGACASHVAVYFSLLSSALGPDILLNLLFENTVTLCSSLHMRG